MLAFPSVKEGFGLAVLEAMSAGIPVVTSDLPVFREYLVPGGTRCWCRSVTRRAGRRAARPPWGTPTCAPGSCRAGAAVAARFTWERSARRHLDVYAGLEDRDRLSDSA